MVAGISEWMGNREWRRGRQPGVAFKGTPSDLLLPLRAFFPVFHNNVQASRHIHSQTTTVDQNKWNTNMFMWYNCIFYMYMILNLHLQL